MSPVGALGSAFFQPLTSLLAMFALYVWVPCSFVIEMRIIVIFSFRDNAATN